MTAQFFEFLYLDEGLLDQFVAQVEGGLFDDERQKLSSAGKAGGSGGVNFAGVQLGASGERTSQDEVERTVRQTPESRFGRLYSALVDSPVLSRFDGEDGPVWNEVQERTLVAADGEVEIPQIARAIGMADEIEPLLNLFKSFGVEGAEDFDETKIKALASLDKVSGGKRLCVVTTHPDDPKFVGRMEARYIRRPLDDFEGEVTIVGRVLKKIPEGRTYPMLALPGLDLMPREQRRQLDRVKADDPENPAMLSGPAVTLSVLAVFR